MEQKARETAIMIVSTLDRNGFGCLPFKAQKLIEAFVDAAIAEEREACALIAESGKEFKPPDHRYEAEQIAKQIRERCE